MVHFSRLKNKRPTKSEPRSVPRAGRPESTYRLHRLHPWLHLEHAALSQATLQRPRVVAGGVLRRPDVIDRSGRRPYCAPPDHVWLRWPPRNCGISSKTCISILCHFSDRPGGSASSVNSNLLGLSKDSSPRPVHSPSVPLPSCKCA